MGDGAMGWCIVTRERNALYVAAILLGILCLFL
jgi:hypothetical protein